MYISFVWWDQDCVQKKDVMYNPFNSLSNLDGFYTWATFL